MSLSFGLIPTIQPAFYQHFPQNFQVIFGSSITSTVIVVFVLNLFFNHWGGFTRRNPGTLEIAFEAGAIAPEPEKVAEELETAQANRDAARAESEGGRE